MSAQPKTPFDEAASRYIATIASVRRITQKDLGKMAGISPATMGRYWRGETAMTTGTFRKLLHVLDVPTDDVIEEIDRIQVTGEVHYN